MNILLCYVTPYSLIAVLNGDKTVSVKFPYPAFFDNYSDIWESVYGEALFRLGLKSPLNTIVVCNSQDLLYPLIKGKSVKVVPAQEAFSEFNIPMIFLGEKRVYCPQGCFELNINSEAVFKWFDFEESVVNVTNFFQNRFLYGPAPAESVWEKSFQNALIRAKMQAAFRLVSPNFLETVEELYLSGEALYGFTNFQELLLNFLDAMEVLGFWRLYFDDKAVLGPLAGLYPEKERALKILNKYPFKRVADVFIVPGVASAQIIFEDGKKQTLNLAREGIHLVPLSKEELTVKLRLKKGHFEKKVSAGVFGAVFDTRKRPLAFSDLRSERFTMRDNIRKQVRGWGSQIKSSNNKD